MEIKIAKKESKKKNTVEDLCIDTCFRHDGKIYTTMDMGDICDTGQYTENDTDGKYLFVFDMFQSILTSILRTEEVEVLHGHFVIES